MSDRAWSAVAWLCAASITLVSQAGGCAYSAQKQATGSADRYHSAYDCARRPRQRRDGKGPRMRKSTGHCSLARGLMT